MENFSHDQVKELMNKIYVFVYANIYVIVHGYLWMCIR